MILPELKVVQAKISHLEQLTALVVEYRAIYEEDAVAVDTSAFLRRLLETGQAVTFVALEADSSAIAGFANLYPSFSTLALQRLWILNDLFVRKEFRGRGVARALIRRVMTFAQETGAVRVELKTSVGNGRARRLYESVGFPLDREHVYYRVPVPHERIRT